MMYGALLDVFWANNAHYTESNCKLRLGAAPKFNETSSIKNNSSNGGVIDKTPNSNQGINYLIVEHTKHS